MIDYLEQLLEGADALAEQVRRLERGLSGPGAARTGEREAHVPLRTGGETAGSFPQGGRAAPAQEEAAQAGRGERGRERREASPAPFQNTQGPETPERVLAPLERGEEAGLPRQLERLERAVRSAARQSSAGWERSIEEPWDGPAGLLSVSRPGRGFFAPEREPAEGWTAGSGFAGPAARSAGPLERAEETDRVFRRDSRRYDGGFYLY